MVMKLRYSTYISYACCMLHIHQKLFGWGTGKPPRKTLCICMFASRCPSDEGSGASLLVGNGCRVFGLPWSSILHYSKVCFPSQGAAAAAVEESSNPAERSASSASGLFEDLGREQYRGGTSANDAAMHTMPQKEFPCLHSRLEGLICHPDCDLKMQFESSLFRVAVVAKWGQRRPDAVPRCRMSNKERQSARPAIDHCVILCFQPNSP